MNSQFSTTRRHQYHADNDKSSFSFFTFPLRVEQSKYPSTKLNLCSTSDYMCALFTHRTEIAGRTMTKTRNLPNFLDFTIPNAIFRHSNPSFSRIWMGMKAIEMCISCFMPRFTEMFRCLHGLGILVRRGKMWRWNGMSSRTAWHGIHTMAEHFFPFGLLHQAKAEMESHSNS